MKVEALAAQTGAYIVGVFDEMDRLLQVYAAQHWSGFRLRDSQLQAQASEWFLRQHT